MKRKSYAQKTFDLNKKSSSIVKQAVLTMKEVLKASSSQIVQRYQLDINHINQVRAWCENGSKTKTNIKIEKLPLNKCHMETRLIFAEKFIGQSDMVKYIFSDKENLEKDLMVFNTICMTNSRWVSNDIGRN